MCSSSENGDAMVFAPLTRYPDKPPTLGEWVNEGQPDRMGGRFGDAINLGLRISREMPPEMVEIIDQGWAAGTAENLMERFVNVARNFTGPPATRAAHVHILADPPNPAQVAAKLWDILASIVGPSFDRALMERALVESEITMDEITTALVERRFDDLKVMLARAQDTAAKATGANT
jgi:hypothetical protein